MKNVISVIVPVYNVENYLAQCLDSILQQSYGNLEVIVVDDGSTDRSGEICEQYAAADQRIHVIHQKNTGGAGAKNTGLRAASGEYLSFVDSDDYLEPGAYAYMMELLKTHNADVVRCSFRNVFRTRSEDHSYHADTAVVEGKDFLRTFASDWTCGLLWNKLYRRELFDGILFVEGHKIDDEYFTYQGIMNARRVVCDDRIIYNYRKRASSVMSSAASRKQLNIDRIDYMAKRREKVIQRFPDLRRDFDVAFVDALTYLPDYPDVCEEGIRAYREYGKAYFREKGRTFPPRYLLKGLLRLYVTSAKKLVERSAKNKLAVDMGDFFP